MRLLVTTGGDPQMAGGAWVHAFKIVKRAMLSIDEVLVGLPTEVIPQDRIAAIAASGAKLINVEVDGYNTEKRSALVSRTLRLSVTLVRHRIDTVIVLSPYTQWAIPILLAAALVRTPVVHVLTLAGVHSLRPRILRALAWARRHNQSYVAVSDYCARCTAQTFQMHPAEVITIYNGCPDIPALSDEDRTRARAELAAELGVPATVPLLLTVAALRPQKGHEYLIMAMRQLLRVRPDVQFLWAGTGDLRSSLEDMASSYGVRGAIHFLGQRNDVLRLMGAADLFVFPTLFEGLPLAVLEAMAVGLPVVASDCTSLPELIESGHHGLLFRTGNPCDLVEKVTWALEHPKEMLSMAHGARARVRAQFTEGVMTGRTVTLAQALGQGRE